MTCCIDKIRFRNLRPLLLILTPVLVVAGILVAAVRPRPAPPAPPEIVLEPASPSPEPAVEPSPRELAEPSPERLEEYASRRPKSVLELQLYRRVSSIETSPGSKTTLASLNPAANSWFVLGLESPEAPAPAFYHLENADPEGTEVVLEERFPTGVILRSGSAEAQCTLSSDGLEAARASARPFAGLCGGRLYLRNPTTGRRTRLEMATDFLRDNVWAGEKITAFVRQNLYKDRFLETSELIRADDPAAAAERPRPRGAPPRPLVDPRYEGLFLAPAELGLELVNERPGEVLVGRWYAVRGQPGVFVSTIQARLVAPEVIESQKRLVNPLDEVESSALVYMVAFDLGQMELSFALGTDHPRLEWSERVSDTVRDESLPGPDGFATAEPLVRTGKLSPVAAKRVAATFTGGFKRSHGAFKRTALATSNEGSHYGFVESGTVLSKLRPGLATVVVWDDGTVEAKTWTVEDDARLGHVRHARQNGLPIVETDPATGKVRPGALVPRWGDGNWSGSQDQRLRTLRAGLCLVESGEGPFLVYGYFSGATPSGMARVFQAYGCGYAFLLDMNALEHTYLALYHVDREHFLTQHLIEGMSVLDESGDGRELPRFVALADNRDFFYLTRKAER